MWAECFPTYLRSASSTDVVRQYLRDIGRVAMLSEEEELTLARQVQRRQRILDQHLAIEKPGADLIAVARASGISEAALRQTLRQGRRAKERMIQANLRLVVAVAKKYQRQGMELLDLVQEGTLGLERGVERFDPTRGFRFSTFAYWWIRQGITRAIANQSRMIRLPSHVSEKLSRIRSGSWPSASGGRPLWRNWPPNWGSAKRCCAKPWSASPSPSRSMAPSAVMRRPTWWSVWRMRTTPRSSTSSASTSTRRWRPFSGN